MITSDATPSSRPHPGGLASLGARPVAQLGFGTMQLEHGDDEPALGLLRRAVELRAEVEANLRTLDLERLDVVNIYPMYRTQGISPTSGRLRRPARRANRPARRRHDRLLRAV
jgi:hypothetical protein